ncbi:MAG: DUF2110 family protein [Halobacteriota archaeon]
MSTLYLMQLVCGQANKVGLSFAGMLHNDLDKLRVTYSFELTKWISVTISGPDEGLAANLLTKKYGTLHDVQRGDIVRAWLVEINDTGLVLDAGGKRVLVPQSKLKQLGRGTTLQVASRFGLIRCLPLEVHLVEENDAELTKNQIDTFWKWKRGTDRVNVNNATRAQIHAVLKRSGHIRDIYAIERLGILEHSIVCKHGTDAPGLIPIIGPLLESQLGCVRGDNTLR